MVQSVVSLHSFDQLYQRADALRQPVSVAVAGGADPTVLQALRTASERGWVRPWIFGKARDIHQAAHELGVRLDGLDVVDTEDAPAAGVALVRSGGASLLMKGQIATPALMKAVLDPASGLRTGRVICQVVLIELSHLARRFLMADTGICIQPTLAQKIDIIRSAVTLAHSLGAVCPRVAGMAATESTVASMPETLDAAELQRLNQTGEIGGCLVRGPLSFDMAFDSDASAKKQGGNPDFDVADVMLFPNLLAANLTVKAIMYTASCRFGGMLCGTACPVVFMSRADTAVTRLNSLALALHSLVEGS
jgi:phosphotransacetylase